MRDGREIAELPHEVLHLDLHGGLLKRIGCKSTEFRRLGKDVALRGILLEQRHEAVLEPRGNRRCCKIQRCECRELLRIAAQDEAHDTARRHSIEDAVLRQQPALQGAQRHALWRPDRIAHPLRDTSELFWCAGLEETAAVEHVDRLAKRRFLHVGRADEHRQMLLAHELLQDLPELAARQWVDADSRLVEQQQLRRAHERASKAELLLHAAGELAREPPREGRELRHRQEMREALRAQFLRHAVQVGIEVQVLLHRQVFVEAEFLRHVAQEVLHRLRMLCHIQPDDGKLSCGLRHQAANQPHQRRLAGAIRPDERRKPAFWHREVHAPQGLDRLAVLLQEVLRQSLCLDDHHTTTPSRQRSILTVAGMPRRRTFSSSST